MGISFYCYITCFDQASQYPPSSFFASLSWHPKPARNPDPNLGCGVLFTDPVASFNAFIRDITSQLLKNDYHFLLQSICFQFTRNVYISKHSRLEYCAFYQHWRSILTSLLDSRILVCFVTDNSACNLEKDSFNLRISTSTFLFTSSGLFWSDKIIGIRSFLLIFCNDPFV